MAISILEDRQAKNDLRSVMDDAQERGILKPEEFGFVQSLIKRFKTDITKKEKLVQVTLGEINQLKTNLQVIVEMVNNLIAAEERAEARRETARKLREDRTAAVEKAAKKEVEPE